MASGSQRGRKRCFPITQTPTDWDVNMADFDRFGQRKVPYGAEIFCHFGKHQIMYFFFKCGDKYWIYDEQMRINRCIVNPTELSQILALLRNEESEKLIQDVSFEHLRVPNIVNRMMRMNSTGLSRTPMPDNSQEPSVPLLLPHGWTQNHLAQKAATESFPFEQLGLPTGAAVLTSSDQFTGTTLHLIQSGHEFFFYNKFSGDVRPITSPCTLPSIIAALKSPEALELSTVQRLALVDSATFGFMPDGWSRDIYVPSTSVIDRFERWIFKTYGLQLYPLLAKGTQILYSCGGALLVKESKKVDLHRVDYPTTPAEMLKIPEPLDTPRLFPLTRAIPDNLVPRGWTDRYRHIPLLAEARRAISILLARDGEQLYLVDIDNYWSPHKYALWKYPEQEVTYLEQPSALYLFLPLLNHPHLLQTSMGPLPRTAKRGLEVWKSIIELNELNELHS